MKSKIKIGLVFASIFLLFWSIVGMRLPCSCESFAGIEVDWAECEEARSVTGKWIFAEREISFIKYKILKFGQKIPEHGEIEGGWKWGRSNRTTLSPRAKRVAQVFGLGRGDSEAQEFDLINSDMSMLACGVYFPDAKKMVVLFYLAP